MNQILLMNMYEYKYAYSCVGLDVMGYDLSVILFCSFSVVLLLNA